MVLHRNHKCVTNFFRAVLSRFRYSDRAGAALPSKRPRKSLSVGPSAQNLSEGPSAEPLQNRGFCCLKNLRAVVSSGSLSNREGVQRPTKGRVESLFVVLMTQILVSTIGRDFQHVCSSCCLKKNLAFKVTLTVMCMEGRAAEQAAFPFLGCQKGERKPC